MDHKVLPRKEWLESRKELLQKEKDFTKLRDELTQQRRDLPWKLLASHIYLTVRTVRYH